MSTSVDDLKISIEIGAEHPIRISLPMDGNTQTVINLNLAAAKAMRDRLTKAIDFVEAD